MPLCQVSNIKPQIFVFRKAYFASRKERLFMDVHTYFRILNSPGKTMTYLRDTNKFLRYCTLCTSILKCGFPAKGIELKRLVYFEVLRVAQLWGTSVWTISVGTARKSTEKKRSYKVRHFSVPD